MQTRYQRIPDSGHPTTERFAEDLFAHARERAGTWETQTAETREYWRERARRFMAGDTSVLPVVDNALRVR